MELQVKRKVAKPGTTTYNIDDNTGIGVSYGPKNVHDVSVYSPSFSL